MITLIDTEKVKDNIYLLTQCRYQGLTAVCAEREMEFSSRLEAACVNVGLVARWFIDEKITDRVKIIILKTDTLNRKQYRYNNEHSILVSVLQPCTNAEMHKNLSLYKSGVFGQFDDLERYFAKARRYIAQANIELVLSDKLDTLPQTFIPQPILDDFKM